MHDVTSWLDADFLQRLHLCPLLGAIRTRFARPGLFRVSPLSDMAAFWLGREGSNSSERPKQNRPGAR